MNVIFDTELQVNDEAIPVTITARVYADSEGDGPTARRFICVDIDGCTDAAGAERDIPDARQSLAIQEAAIQIAKTS